MSRAVGEWRLDADAAARELSVVSRATVELLMLGNTSALPLPPHTLRAEILSDLKLAHTASTCSFMAVHRLSSGRADIAQKSKSATQVQSIRLN